MADTLSLVITALISGGGASTVVMLLKARSEVRKTNAETLKTDADFAATISETSVALLDPLRKELDRVNAKLAETEQRVDTLMKHVAEQQAELDAYRATYGHL